VTGAAAHELQRAVAARAAGTPYVVVPTDEGFDLRVDLVDATWYGLLAQAGRRKVVQHRVLLDEATRQYVLVDDHVDVEWHVGAELSGPGVPRLVARREKRRTSGRAREYSWEKTFGTSAETLRPAVVVDYVFRSSEGQDMVREPARELGWQERAGTAERIGRVAGLIGGVGALVTLVGMGGALATGAFG
jgi:hypothetical protein